jgi:cell wall-associated NlpC family hydrolase
MTLLYDLALHMLNIPYIWGGKNPTLSLDCSGLVNVLLHAYGLDIPNSNAQILFDHFSKGENHKSVLPELGALVFYGNSATSIDHVEMALNGHQQIGANGGGEHIKTLTDAIASHAYVKVTPIYQGPKLQGIFMPFYPEAP